MADNIPDGLSDPYWDLFPEDNITGAVKDANRELSSRSKASMKEATAAVKKADDGSMAPLKSAGQEYLELANKVDAITSSMQAVADAVVEIHGSLMAHHDGKVGSLCQQMTGYVANAGSALDKLSEYLNSEGAKLSGEGQEKAPESKAPEGGDMDGPVSFDNLGD